MNFLFIKLLTQLKNKVPFSFGLEFKVLQEIKGEREVEEKSEQHKLILVGNKQS